MDRGGGEKNERERECEHQRWKSAKTGNKQPWGARATVGKTGEGATDVLSSFGESFSKS
jgi:hypothetical protein